MAKRLFYRDKFVKPGIRICTRPVAAGSLQKAPRLFQLEFLDAISQNITQEKTPFFIHQYVVIPRDRTLILPCPPKLFLQLHIQVEAKNIRTFYDSIRDDHIVYAEQMAVAVVKGDRV